MVKLTEIISYVSHIGHGVDAKNEVTFSLREIYVNPKHVVMLRADESLDAKHKEKPLIQDLIKKTRFTKVSMNTGSNTCLTVCVVGDTDVISKKLGK